MNIEIKAAFPIEWDREYYTVESKEKKVFAPCVACDNTGRVRIKGEEYICPRCKGTTFLFCLQAFTSSAAPFRTTATSTRKPARKRMERRKYVHGTK